MEEPGLQSRGHFVFIFQHLQAICHRTFYFPITGRHKGCCEPTVLLILWFCFPVDFREVSVVPGSLDEKTHTRPAGRQAGVP